MLGSELCAAKSDFDLSNVDDDAFIYLVTSNILFSDTSCLPGLQRICHKPRGLIVQVLYYARYTSRAKSYRIIKNTTESPMPWSHHVFLSVRANSKLRRKIKQIKCKSLFV